MFGTLLLVTGLSWLMLDGVTPGTRRRWFRFSAMAIFAGVLSIVALVGLSAQR